MKRAIGRLVGIGMVLMFQVSVAHAITVLKAEIELGAVQVIGAKAASRAEIRWEDQVVTRSDRFGFFHFSTTNLPQDCVGKLGDGVTTIDVVVKDCQPAAPPVRVTQQADEEAYIVESLPAFASTATISITAAKAGTVLVNGWMTIIPIGLPGHVFVRVRDADTNEVSTIQAVTHDGVGPTPISIGWLFNVSAGEHTYSLDGAVDGVISRFGNMTLRALYVP
jgi:hypothetical protein